MRFMRRGEMMKLIGYQKVLYDELKAGKENIGMCDCGNYFKSKYNHHAKVVTMNKCRSCRKKIFVMITGPKLDEAFNNAVLKMDTLDGLKQLLKDELSL